MTRRRSSKFIVDASRNSSQQRRASVAGWAGDASTIDVASLRRFLARVRAKHLGEPRAAKALVDYSYTLRSSGRGAIVELVNRVLLADGGRALDLITRAPEASCVAIATQFIRIANERGVRDAAALSLLLRSCVTGEIANSFLAKLLGGRASKVEAGLVDRLLSSSRIDLMRALQLAVRPEAHAAAGPDVGADWVDHAARAVLARAKDGQGSRDPLGTDSGEGATDGGNHE